MRHALLLTVSLLCSACVRARAPVPHAPPEEAARVKFPLGTPEEGRVLVEGNTLAALMLAMEDFLPRGGERRAEGPREEECLRRRESYDVTTAPGPEGVILVRFAVNRQACSWEQATLDAATGEPLVDVTTYAVDVRAWRVLSVQRTWRPLGRL